MRKTKEETQQLLAEKRWYISWNHVDPYLCVYGVPDDMPDWEVRDMLREHYPETIPAGTVFCNMMYPAETGVRLYRDG